MPHGTYASSIEPRSRCSISEQYAKIAEEEGFVSRKGAKYAKSAKGVTAPRPRLRVMNKRKKGFAKKGGKRFHAKA